MYDFNKDGTKELIVESARGARSILCAYTYYKGKVKYLTDGNGFYYQKDKKYLISYGSGGFQDFDYTAYKISKGKAKKSFKYAWDAGVYKKDGKKIDKKTFTDFQDTLKSNIGKSFTVSKYEYTSPKKIGFNLLKLGTTDTYIKKLSKDKVLFMKALLVKIKGNASAKKITDIMPYAQKALLVEGFNEAKDDLLSNIQRKEKELQDILF